VSSCLGVPGAANLRHEVTQVVVAEDLFQLCEVEMSPGETAAAVASCRSNRCAQSSRAAFTAAFARRWLLWPLQEQEQFIEPQERVISHNRVCGRCNMCDGVHIRVCQHSSTACTYAGTDATVLPTQ
jgi:hypothetical protein